MRKLAFKKLKYYHGYTAGRVRIRTRMQISSFSVPSITPVNFRLIRLNTLPFYNKYFVNMPFAILKCTDNKPAPTYGFKKYYIMLYEGKMKRNNL